MNLFDVQHILADLDKHASEFNFPVLDNAYLELADCRLTAFRNNTDWVIAFEVVGWSNRELEFVNDLYAYGSRCVYPEGIQGEEIVVRQSARHPILDPESREPVARWGHWHVVLDDNEYAFEPSREEYREAGVEISSSSDPVREADLLRFLVHRLGHRFFASDEVLLAKFLKCKDLKKLLQTSEWQHPDVAAEEMPSQSVSIRSLLHAINSSDPSLFDTGRPNTDWRNWVHEDETAD